MERDYYKKGTTQKTERDYMGREYIEDKLHYMKRELYRKEAI